MRDEKSQKNFLRGHLSSDKDHLLERAFRGPVLPPHLGRRSCNGNTANLQRLSGLSAVRTRADCRGGPVEEDEGFLRLEGGIERGRDQDKSSANLMADSRAPSFAGVNVVKYASSVSRGTVVIVSAFATLGRGTPSAGPRGTSTGILRTVCVSGTTVTAVRTRYA